MLTKGRLKNTGAHHEFLTVFLKPTYVDKQFREAVQGGKEFSDIVSVSDESFSKLLMINLWSRWEDINQIHKNKFRSEKRHSDKKKQSTVQPKYTSSFSNVSRNTTNLTRGWGQDGINTYNDLCKGIVFDRKERIEVDNKWFLSYREIFKKTKKRKIDTFVPIAWNEFDDLFDQSDSDSDDDDGSKTVLEPQTQQIAVTRNG